MGSTASGHAWGPVRDGEALVSPEPIHFVFDVDKSNGTIINRTHPLYGASFVDKIVVMGAAKGGV